jgi:hypothetical protein
MGLGYVGRENVVQYIWRWVRHLYILVYHGPLGRALGPREQYGGVGGWGGVGGSPVVPQPDAREHSREDIHYEGTGREASNMLNYES